jgi:hypothetical protein
MMHVQFLLLLIPFACNMVMAASVDFVVCILPILDSIYCIVDCIRHA